MPISSYDSINGSISDAYSNFLQGDTAQASTQIAAATLGSDVNVSMVKKSLDFQKEQASQMMQLLGVGANIDLSA